MRVPARENQQLHDIARGIATEDGELPDGAELDMLLDSTVCDGRWVFGAKRTIDLRE